MNILTITRGDEIITINPDTLLIVLDHWDAEGIFNQLEPADVSVTFMDDLLAAHNGEWIGVPAYPNEK